MRANERVLILIVVLGWQVGTRVVMVQGKRWQGVGTINRIHDNETTCAVKWDSGRCLRAMSHARAVCLASVFHTLTCFALIRRLRVGVTCSRLDRSLLLADLLVKKAAGGAATPAKMISDEPATPAADAQSSPQTPSAQDQSYVPAATITPPGRSAPQRSSPPPAAAPSPVSPAAPATSSPNSQSPAPAKKGSGSIVGTVLGLAVVVGAVVAFNVMKRK
jgi:hypothetical protein